jgi:hypothetical protein
MLLMSSTANISMACTCLGSLGVSVYHVANGKRARASTASISISCTCLGSMIVSTYYVVNSPKH